MAIKSKESRGLAQMVYLFIQFLSVITGLSIVSGEVTFACGGGGDSGACFSYTCNSDKTFKKTISGVTVISHIKSDDLPPSAAFEKQLDNIRVLLRNPKMSKLLYVIDIYLDYSATNTTLDARYDSDKGKFYLYINTNMLRNSPAEIATAEQMKAYLTPIYENDKETIDATRKAAEKAGDFKKKFGKDLVEEEE